ncbi:MAG: PIN domain-containing protein [Spirochaetaceae bacterium]|nr:MAG: PIN domain-containing protein [Spirochaetaceae bacterium]
MLFLDTHVVLWLYAEPSRIPKTTRRIIDATELFISPMVRLEISFLHEIGRFLDEPEGVVGVLGKDLGLRIESTGWARAAEIAAHLGWTRDPFDRLIVAHALAYNAALCSRDRFIRDHYSHAVWDGR